jgi:hypothetical protein
MRVKTRQLYYEAENDDLGEVKDITSELVVIGGEEVAVDRVEQMGVIRVDPRGHRAYKCIERIQSTDSSAKRRRSRKERNWKQQLAVSWELCQAQVLPGAATVQNSFRDSSLLPSAEIAEQICRMGSSAWRCNHADCRHHSDSCICSRPSRSTCTIATLPAWSGQKHWTARKWSHGLDSSGEAKPRTLVSMPLRLS